VRKIPFFLGFSDISGLVSGDTKTQIPDATPAASKMQYVFAIFPMKKPNLTFF
jgi:hypothetical protein